MKKIVQNVLARQSNNQIVYLCGKCGKEVEKEAKICIHCKAKLGNIKCPFCNFTGTIVDFKFDTCPKCGRKNISNKKIKINFKDAKRLKFTKKIFWLLFFLLLSGIIIILYILIYLYK